MAEPRITIDSLLTTDETDIFMSTSEFSCGDEDSLLTRDEDDDGDEDEIPNAQKCPRTNVKEDEPETSKNKNNRDRKHPREDSNRTPSSDGKRVRLNEDRERASIQKRMNASNEAIGKLKDHLDKGTCPKSLRYSARANITPDEDFKNDISSIRKKAEHAYVGALVRFHNRRVERLMIKLRKLEQAKSRKRDRVTIVTKNKSSERTHSAARTNDVNIDVNRLAQELQAKIAEVDNLIVEAKTAKKNKSSECYPCLFSESSEEGEKGKTYRKNTKAIKNRKRKERRLEKDKKRFRNVIESPINYIKSMSNEQLTDEQISLLSKDSKFIPTPATKENLIRRQLLLDFNQFARRMRLQHIFYGKESETHPFHVKSDWEPPAQPSVALETFLEEDKLELAEIKLDRPKDNLSFGERKALRELSRDKSIILKKADKGSTTVIMSREDKINEGQVLLDDINNYRSLKKPMVETTAKKVNQLIKSLLQGNHIDEMTAKWLSLTPNPPHIPVFYTLTKIHKPTPVGRPIISGCDGPTEWLSSFVDRLIQPIAQKQDSYLKDTTDFINFIEKTKLPQNVILASMDVVSFAAARAEVTQRSPSPSGCFKPTYIPFPLFATFLLGPISA